MAENKVDLPSPDALAPAAIEAKAEALALAKTRMGLGETFLLAIMAGGFIALGGMFFGLVMGDTQMGFAAGRFLGGVSFCLGLTCVVCCGAELFTGNTLMVCAALSKKIRWLQVLRNWVTVWLGNLVGALVVVALVYWSQMHQMNGGAVGAALVGIAAGKLGLSFGTAVAKGILCNVLVCIAVWICFAGKTIADKVLGLLLPVTAFVACGFEHCVANMFFLPMGMLLHGVGVGGVAAEVMTWGNVFVNMAGATLGNIIGGGLLIGGMYWLIYGRKH